MKYQYFKEVESAYLKWMPYINWIYDGLVELPSYEGITYRGDKRGDVNSMFRMNPSGAATTVMFYEYLSSSKKKSVA